MACAAAALRRGLAAGTPGPWRCKPVLGLPRYVGGSLGDPSSRLRELGGGAPRWEGLRPRALESGPGGVHCLTRGGLKEGVCTTGGPVDKCPGPPAQLDAEGRVPKERAAALGPPPTLGHAALGSAPAGGERGLPSLSRDLKTGIPR